MRLCLVVVWSLSVTTHIFPARAHQRCTDFAVVQTFGWLCALSNQVHEQDILEQPITNACHELLVSEDLKSPYEHIQARHDEKTHSSALLLWSPHFALIESRGFLAHDYSPQKMVISLPHLFLPDIRR
jgi:hypothetical protein